MKSKGTGNPVKSRSCLATVFEMQLHMPLSDWEGEAVRDRKSGDLPDCCTGNKNVSRFCYFMFPLLILCEGMSTPYWRLKASLTASLPALVNMGLI